MPSMIPIRGAWFPCAPARRSAKFFSQNGLNPGVLQQLLGNSANASALKNVHPGDEFAFLRAADGTLSRVAFRP